MIKTVHNDKLSIALCKGMQPRKLDVDVARQARKKINMIKAAKELDDLKSPPGNRLEALSGDRDGQHSIRVNKQYRICFEWRDGDAYDVEFCDYHR